MYYFLSNETTPYWNRMADSDQDLGLGPPETDLKETSEKLRSTRSGKLSHLTRRRNIVDTLMDDETHLEEIKGNMDKFNAMFDEFKSNHESYQATLSDEDRSNDTTSWYIPKLEQINAFMDNVAKWIAATERQDTEHDVPVSSSGLEISADVKFRPPDDRSFLYSDRESTVSRRSVSSTESVCIRVEAERAALLAKVATLQEKHALEDQQEQLDCQREKLRKRMETLDLETELDATTAKIEYLKNAESQAVKGNALDAMNTYLEENVESVSLPFLEQLRDTRLKDGVQVQFPVSHTLPRTPRVQYSMREQSIYPLQAPSRSSVPNPGQESDNLSKILEKQNQLTSLLIKQQMLNTLPKGDLTAFDGNVLQLGMQIIE
ncbi:uncharacterized protein LOC132452529 [Gadus macrocephalus]|uniref:uncharacterized protein LOC132452529 n=1 Tax=Gadus macrocephalus TaxID=80720 RepID=UPI0028CBBE64|nr:uncharacterized protein LOC132452529 [Gadus macrocephalus]